MPLLIIFVLAISLFFGYHFYQPKTFPARPSTTIITPTVSIIATPSATPTNSWKIYTAKKMGFRLKYPPKIEIKEGAGGDLDFDDDDIHISFVQGVLSENETINTLAEKQINQKMAKSENQFKLIDTISPIALDTVTGITYRSEEPNGRSIYYYVPQKNSRYLLISNQISTASGQPAVSLSDQIIYSLELLP